MISFGWRFVSIYCFALKAVKEAAPKVSQFAKKRGLQKEEAPASSKSQPKLILGEVIEKLDESQSTFDRISESNEAFPKACRIDRSVSLSIESPAMQLQ